ncbi:MAG: hypothetical protein AB7T63_11320 [Planctomycetota bacterium]
MTHILQRPRRPGVVMALPVVIVAHYVAHVVHVPWVAPATLLFGLAYFLWPRRPTLPPSDLAQRPPGRWTLIDALLAATLVAPLAVSCVVQTVLVAASDESVRFAFVDAPYDLMMARGLGHAMPPPDLSWNGQAITYHFGAPLLLDFLHRATGLPLHAVQAGVLPAVLKASLLAACVMLAARALAGGARRRVLLGCLAGLGLLPIDVYNAAWQARALALTGPSSLLGGAMSPMALWSDMPLLVNYQGSTLLGITCLLVLVAHLGRTRWPWMAVCLVAVYLAKQQLALAAFPAMGVTCILTRDGHIRRQLIAACATAALAVLVFRALAVTPEHAAGLHLDLAANDYFVRLGRGTDPLHARLVENLPLGLMVVGLGAVLGLHIYLVAAVRFLRQRWGGLGASGRAVVFFVATGMAASIAIMCAFRLRMSPRVNAAYDAVHGQLGGAFWKSGPEYREDLMNVSLAAVLQGWPLAAAVLLGACLVWYAGAGKGRARTIATALLVLSPLVYAGRATLAWRQDPPATWMEVPADVVAALRIVPPELDQVVDTNDLGYGEGRGFPLVNNWAPQLFGHQFHASNFTFGTPAYPDYLVRWNAQQRFWSEEVGAWHEEHVVRQGIRWLLVRRDRPFAPGLLEVDWLKARYSGSTHLLLECVVPTRESR